jgi:hypothetical protein
MRERLPLVLSITALAVALLGPTAWTEAANLLPRNSVGANQIKSGGVGKAELKTGAVDSSRLKNNSVDSIDLRNGRVASADLADGGVGAADLADGAVGAAKIADGGVGAAELAAGAVTAAKIAPGVVPAGSGPVARVSNNANVPVPTGSTANVIPFNTEAFDQSGMHRTDVDPSRLTVTTPGVYLITTNITWAPHLATEATEVNLRKNGTTNIARVVQMGGGANTSDQSVTAIESLAAGDYIEVTVRQNSGGALNVLVAEGFSPQFSIAWLAPAPA